MNNRHIIQNQYYGNINIDRNELKKIPDKECCLVCAIILCYNLTFLGIMIGLIQNEDLNLNSTIF